MISSRNWERALRPKVYKPLLLRAEDIRSFELLGTDHLQIVIGPKRPQGKRIFRAQPSYLPGFWYLDRKGFYWNSSLVDREFVPDKLDQTAAKSFFDKLRSHFVGNNKSKRPQPP